MNMKRIFILMIALIPLLSVGCKSTGKSTADGTEPINLIMETDIGNDVDDALAMDLLYKYIDAGTINLLATCINKEGAASAEFMDILNTWYGYPDIPIGIIHNGPDCASDAINYAEAVVMQKNEDGSLPFKRSLKSYEDLPDAHILYRKLLAKAKDKSVVIASVGFSSNLARLLQTGPDKYSKLDGKELVEKKVKLLVTMAGNFVDPNHHEYNVFKDIPAAKTILEDWPTPVVTSPFELGIQVLYPATSIENDFGWAGKHPVVEAYKAYLPMPYDRPTWDPTGVLYAVEGDKWFDVSEPGTIRVTEEGSTFFTPDPNGTRRYLSVSPQQAEAIKKHFIEVITTPPAVLK